MPKIDMRNTMDFFCMLKACALIKQLKPGNSVLILSNDRAFLSDLRQVHPDCEFKLISTVHAFEDGGDYLFRVEKSNPSPNNLHRKGGSHVQHECHLPVLPGNSNHNPDR